MDRVLIVVLNWNGLDDTERCIESLAKQTYGNFTIALIDNASTEANTDDRLARIEKELGADKLIILRNTTNKGFAGGVNTGIRHALANNFDYVALFNNDAVADPDWLKALVAAAQRENSTITTGLLLHEHGDTIDSTGDYYSMWGLPFPRSRGDEASTAPMSGQVFGGSGGATLYITELFKKIGLFDETFFAYYEDVDISFRSNLIGNAAYYEKTAVAFHKQGASSNKIPGFAVKQTFKNLPLLYVKNVPNSLLVPIGIRFWTAYWLMAAKALLGSNRTAALHGIFQGIGLFWTHGLPERFNVQKLKTISSAELRKLLWNDLPPDQTGLRKLFGKSVK